jgi:hypothetical protein
MHASTPHLRASQQRPRAPSCFLPLATLALLGCGPTPSAPTVAIPEAATVEPLPPDRAAVEPPAEDASTQATPRDAVEGFLRAYDERRFDLIIARYVPSSSAEGLTPEALKREWDADVTIAERMEAIRDALATQEFYVRGDRASFAYAHGELLLVREGKLWKIEDL